MNYPQKPSKADAVLVLADGSVFWGKGTGYKSAAVGEVVFNTSITGYQEVLSDPSYAGQIITFTFPHIGNTGTNTDDNEAPVTYARGLVLRNPLPVSSNWREMENLENWLINNRIVGISGIDTRSLTKRIRDNGAPHGTIHYFGEGNYDLESLQKLANDFPPIDGSDLAIDVTCDKSYSWEEKDWEYGKGYETPASFDFHVIAIDYGVKRNILRSLVSTGCKVTVVPAKTSAAEIIAMKPDGVFLSNGPGDPAETGRYAIPVIQEIIRNDIPVFGICLGHQMLALALGAETYKKKIGHRGANHPVIDLTTGHVEITSQNHGFGVKEETLPDNVEVTHRSLFDNTIEGLRLKGKPVFSVQHHPEASPGPQDSSYLFHRFRDFMKKR